MRGEIVEHPRRREHQPPGECQHALRGARAPAALRIGDAKPAGLSPERLGVACNRAFEVAACLAPAATRVTRRARNSGSPGTDSTMLAVASFERDEPTPAPSADAAGDAAQRKNGAVGKGGGRREPLQPLFQPLQMIAQKSLRLGSATSAKGERRTGRPSASSTRRISRLAWIFLLMTTEIRPLAAAIRQLFGSAGQGESHLPIVARVGVICKSAKHSQHEKKKRGLTGPALIDRFCLSFTPRLRSRVRCGCGNRA